MKRLFTSAIAGFVLFLLSIPAAGQEAFPGQNELAKGLSCYSELELQQALSHLEKALGLLSPGKDPNYMQHVKTAKWIMVLIHIAEDNLQAAEKELTSLLMIDPAFELPPGDQPPKVMYVFRQAKEKMKTQNKSSSRIADKPHSVSKQKKSSSRKAFVIVSNWKLGMTGSVVLLFGNDAKAASSGPGMSLLFGYRIAPRISAIARFEYSYHTTNYEGVALQTAAMQLGAEICLLAQPLVVTTGLDMGALGMGTADRYDHWAFALSGSLNLAWPPEGAWAVLIKLSPSVVFTASNASFYLPVSAGAEVRW